MLWQFEFDLSAGNATMSELETEDIFVADGGSVTTYAGAYIVAFTVTPAEGSFSQYAYFFVVDAAGNKLSEVNAPTSRAAAPPPPSLRGGCHDGCDSRCVVIQQASPTSRDTPHL